MDKLLLHRNSSDNNLAHCYFVVAKEISDWNDTSNIGQIILSTHEDQKARLLRFKFQQADLSVCEHNMQQIYFSAVQ
ncbi:hypothetical protein [Desulfitobacterium hafniense]|uniref:hypothetical protein n=1 Tax=Desulfitobacterium hafniense TaxID=49338 RepID=UPI00128F01C2|nr:hypothetical protein [Desulfitobacterium hafniense]